jgi:hypothetical protein
MAIRSTDARTDSIRPGDHIFSFNATEQKLKYFLSSGMLQWAVEARGKGSVDGFGTNGDTPPGLYQLLQPLWLSEKEREARGLGRWFIPMQPAISNSYVENMRSNLGIHGGGTDLPSPLSNRQGWETTLYSGAKRGPQPRRLRRAARATERLDCMAACRLGDRRQRQEDSQHVLMVLSSETLAEPPRDYRRLHFVRTWSYSEIPSASIQS